MRKILLISLILTSTFGFSQSEETEYEFRQLTGNLIDDYGRPFPGQTIIIKGTDIRTQTDFDGNFCLIVPNDKTIFIELPFCFDQIFREIKPNENFIKLEVGKNKRTSKIANRKWKKMLPELNSFLYKSYNSNEYKNAEKNICR